MSEPILTVRDLNVSFPSEYGTVRAVQDHSYEVHKGEALAIVGESGSGKSVSSLAVMGLLPRTATISGEIEMLGHRIPLSYATTPPARQFHQYGETVHRC